MSSDRASIPTLARVAGTGSRLVLALALLLLWATPATAGSPYPFAGRFHDHLDAAFFEEDHPPDALPQPAKIEAYRRFLRDKLAFATRHVYTAERIDGGRNKASAKSKSLESDVAIALIECLRLADLLEQETDGAAAHQLAAEILTLEYATRSFSEPLDTIKIPIHLAKMFLEWRSPDRSKARLADKEASNLVDPQTGLFHTHDELAALVESGFDISTLDPPDETMFWRKPRSIATTQIADNYLRGGDPLHEGLIAEFPPLDGAVLELNKVHMSQTKPKIDVYYTPPACAEKPKDKQRKCRQKLKLKFGMETHADPVTNALLAALGFNIDVSRHLRNAKVYLPEDYPLARVEKEWIGYFDQQRLHTYFPLESVLSPDGAGHGRDERGEYLVFQRAVAENKPDEIARIGYWAFSEGIATQAREARGFFIFNVWIGNADMKDAGNNKVALRKNHDDEWKMYMVMQDLGHSMGWLLPERADIFPWDVVETGPLQSAFGAVNQSIEFDYIDLQPNGLPDLATYADNRWMVRKVAQLTREQIEAAVELGDFPGHIGELYTEKLINRRNQLVEAFGLSDEFEKIPVDRHLTTEDGTIVDGRVLQGRYEGSPHNFNDHWRDAIFPIGTLFAEMFTTGVQAGAGAIDTINPGNISIGGSVDILPRVLLRVSRKVLLNPAPEGMHDQYIVVDTLRFGLRIGVGYIGSGEGTWLKRIVLCYPVATHKEGVYSPIGAMNFLRNVESRKPYLPEHFVLYREDIIKAGIRVSSDGTTLLLPFGAEGSHNWVRTRRSVVDKRGVNPIVWRDEPKSIENLIGLYLEFFKALQVPFYGGGTQVGYLDGEAFELDATRLDTVGESGNVIFDDIVFSDRFGEMDQLVIGPPKQASSAFKSFNSWLSLILVSWRAREQHEEITLRSPDGETLRVEHQVERRSRFAWTFLDNGESQELQVDGYLGGIDSKGKLVAEPTVIVSLDIDDLNTHSDELDAYYGTLEQLGGGRRVMAPDFRAEDWELSGQPDGLWSRMLINGRVHLYGGALDRLTHLDLHEYWRLLARKLGISDRELARHRWQSRRAAEKSSMVASRTPEARRIRRLILCSRAVFSMLEDAREATRESDRLAHVVNALYRANFRAAGTFDPIVMSTLLQQANVDDMLDRDELYVDARITRAFADEHNLPDRSDAIGRLGKRRDVEETQYRFFPFTGLEVYDMLNWTRAAD